MQLYKTAYSLLLSMLTLFAWSQDPARELININKSFYKNSNVAMQVTVRYFIDNADKPSKESKTEIYKNSSGYLHKTANYESMTNSDYRINIDHQKKVMVIARVNRPDAKTKKVDVDLFEKENFRLTLDTVMSYYKTVTVKTVDKNTNELLFTFKSGMYDYIRVSYDKTTYLVNGYYIKLNPAAMTDKKDAANHQYSYTITNKYLDKKTLSKKLFNEDNYVSINKQQITPSINYAGYRLVNNIK